MHRLRIPVLRALDKKHHEKSDDRRPSVDDELPGVREVKEGSGRQPDDDQPNPSRERQRGTYSLCRLADLLGVSVAEYTPNQMTYDLRRLRLKGLIYRPPKTNRYLVTPYGWKVARLFSRLDARVFRPAMAMFTGNDAVLPFPLRSALDRADAQLDLLIYQAFPLPKAG